MQVIQALQAACTALKRRAVGHAVGHEAGETAGPESCPFCRHDNAFAPLPDPAPPRPVRGAAPGFPTAVIHDR